MTDAEQRREWHLDRKVTIGLIVALTLHGGSTVWWAASLSNRVAQLEQRVSDARRLPERLSAIEAMQAAQGEYLKRIDAKMDRLIERGM
jgi:uncharacterized coiled-coil protein SlyX